MAQLSGILTDFQKHGRSHSVEELAKRVHNTIRLFSEGNISLKVGRYIGVDRDPDAGQGAPAWHVRRLVLVATDSTECRFLHVNLTKDDENKPTERAIYLDSEAIEGIREDIRWCGHCEYTWLPIWPEPEYAPLRNLLTQRLNRPPTPG